MSNKDIDLIGIGNAIVDIITNVDDQFLESKKLIKGSMNLINQKESKEILNKCNIIKKISGGSSANTVVSLAQLGNKVEFIGRIKDDDFGRFFSTDIKKSGTIFDTKPVESNASSAHSIILITPDAERTMCTYLGASIEFDPTNINLNLIEKSKYLYLEGYLWDSELAKQAFLEASKVAKKANTKIILSLSDSFCVDRHRDSFLNLIEEYIDILFCNNSELQSLFKKKNVEDCKESIRSLCEISVVTLGEKGSIILSKNETIEIKPYISGELIDTTGAGDMYAGGFLHGLINKYPLNICGKFGSICSGHIITQLGSRSNTSLKELLNQGAN